LTSLFLLIAAIWMPFLAIETVLHSTGPLRSCRPDRPLRVPAAGLPAP
jgi:hypothetical protein